MKQFKAISPWVWLLLVICIPAFAATVLWLDDSNPKVSNIGMGIGLCSLAAAIGLMVRGEGFFDDRAFHHTRPDGRRMAFKRVTSLLLMVIGLVAMVAMARNAFYHLGWRSVLGAGLVVVLMLGWFTAAVASGFALATHRERRTRCVLIALILLPAVVFILRWDLWRISVRPDSRMLMDSGMWFVLNSSWTALTGMAGFSLVWWLAAGLRRWNWALAVVLCLGVIVPLAPRFQSAREATPEKLPLSEAKLFRKPVVTAPQIEDLEPSRGGESQRRIMSLEGLLGVEKLRRDELITFPSVKCGDEEWITMQAHFTPESSGYGYDFGALTDETEGSKSWSNPIDRIVTKNPKFKNLRPRNSRRVRETANWVEISRISRAGWSDAFTTGATIEPEKFMGSEWKIDGTVIRFEEIGSVEVAKGGSIRIEGGGTLRVWPAFENFYSSTIPYRLMLPGGIREPPARMGYGDMRGFGMTSIRAVVLVDQLTGRAMQEQSYGRSPNTGLASSWIDGGVRIESHGENNWTAEEIRRSRAYFFTARPVARVEAVLPPPEE